MDILSSKQNTDIPENIWKDAEIGKNASQQSKRKPDIRMDIRWGYLRQRFPALASVALTVLCVFHTATLLKKGVLVLSGGILINSALHCNWMDQLAPLCDELKWHAQKR